MATFKEIAENHKIASEKIEAIKQKVKSLNARIERLENKKCKLSDKNWWGESLVRPLLKEVAAMMPDVDFSDCERLTPMGMCNRISVFPEIGGQTLMLCFLPPCDSGILFFENGKRTETYHPNSIGGMNGFGKVSLPVESVEQIVDFLNSQIVRDVNGKVISKGAIVKSVDSDFSGEVVDYREKPIVIVKSDGDEFDVEGSQLEVIG